MWHKKYFGCGFDLNTNYHVRKILKMDLMCILWWIEHICIGQYMVWWEGKIIFNSQVIASPTAAVMQGRRVFSAACKQGWPHLMMTRLILPFLHLPLANQALHLQGHVKTMHLRHPSGWYSLALVVFWPTEVEIRRSKSPKIQPDPLLQLRPILAMSLANWLRKVT